MISNSDYWNSLTMFNLSFRLIGSSLFNISNYFMCPINNSKDTIYKGPSLYYVRVFWGFLVPPTPYVRTLHKVRENCHFIDHPPTLIASRNIKMVPKEIRNSRESHLFFGNLAIYGACKAWATLRGHSTTKYVDKKFRGNFSPFNLSQRWKIINIFSPNLK